MGLFENFPYTNFHELNLDWILQALKEIQTTTEQFVAINSLKYADPIQWNITSQYEKNTIVIDPQTGTAYISVQPVPVGVILTNTDYWAVVFDLERFVTKAAQNFTLRYEPATTLTATFNTPKNSWLIWDDTLYLANTDIIAGDQYVPGSNIIRFTMEGIIGHLADLNTTDKSNLVAAINNVLTILADTTGNLEDLNTTDKSNLVAAINNVLTILADTTGNLEDLNTTDKSNLVAAINNVLTTLASITGDLANLNTTDKSNLVAAINELDSKYKNFQIINVKDFGAVGDGVTNDEDAFNNFLAYVIEHDAVGYIPNGTYLLGTYGAFGYREPFNNHKWAIVGESRANTIIKQALYDNDHQGNAIDLRYCSNFELANFTIECAGSNLQTSGRGLYYVNCNNAVTHDIDIKNVSYNAVIAYSEDPENTVLQNLTYKNMNLYGVKNIVPFNPGEANLRYLYPSGMILENLQNSLIESVNLTGFAWYGIELKDYCRYVDINSCSVRNSVTACHIGGEAQNHPYAQYCNYSNITCYNVDVPIVGGHFDRCYFEVRAFYDLNYNWQSNSDIKKQYAARTSDATYNTFNLTFKNLPYGGLYFDNAKHNDVIINGMTKGTTFEARPLQFVTNSTDNIITILSHYDNMDMNSYPAELIGNTVIDVQDGYEFHGINNSLAQRKRINFNSSNNYNNTNLNYVGSALTESHYSETHTVQVLYGSIISSDKGYIRLLINHPDDAEPSITLRYHNGSTNLNTDYSFTKANLDALFSLINRASDILALLQ